LGYDVVNVKVVEKRNMMKFSVIIPVYNKADTIEAAVNSVYSQDVTDYEIIIIDDGSNDDLNNALADLSCPNLRIIRQNNSGVSVARNVGIANAVGEYICFLDADDLWKSDHLKTIEHLILKYPDADVFVTSHETITPDGKIVKSSKALKGFDDDFITNDFLGILNITSYSVIHTNSVCVKTSVFAKDSICFEQGIKVGEDTDVWYRLALKNKVAVSKNDTTVYRREYSTATKSSFHVHKWIFSLRVQEILLDDEISEKVKESVVQLVDRYKLTSCREYMAEGNRTDAKRLLSEIVYRKGKRYILTYLFTFLPHSLCRLVLKL
jgi:glycosyltransferase involved in cell wall biosynthesis